MPDSLHIVCPDCDTMNRIPAVKLNAQNTCKKCKHKLQAAYPTEPTGKKLKELRPRHEPALTDNWAAWW
jgi:thioredoxin 2